jgi:ATP-dependent Clp protease adapter protein ClpS
MTGVQTWRAAPRAWSSGPVAQLAPAPVKRPGIARPGIAKPKRAPKPKPAQERNRNKEVQKVKKTQRVVEEKVQPPYAVLLLGDEEYEEEHVVISMRAIVDELKQDGKRATQIFEQAQEDGRALITIVPQDVAEMYAQKLTRSIPIIYAVAEKAE